MYETFEKIIKQKGLKVSDVVKATGLRAGLFSEWKGRGTAPQYDRLKLIADYLDVPVELLRTGKMPDPDRYYLNDDTRDMVKFLFENPGHKVLFDAVRKVKPDDVDFVAELIDRIEKD